MPLEKTTAIVLRFVEFSESSGVVTLFTREFGKFGALAKGARRPKGPFESALDLLSVCRIVFLRKTSGALDLLTEAKLLRRFRPAGRDLASLYAGYYVAELLGELTHDDDPHPELFDAAEATLGALASGGAVPQIVLRFELAALRLSGHLPSLELCVECGADVASEGRIAFAPREGGVLCKNCRTGKAHVVSVSPAVIETLKRFADESSSMSSTDELPNGIRGELRALWNNYLYHVLGHKLRLHEYLGTACH